VNNVRISKTPVGIRLNNTVGGFTTALINDLQAINLVTFGLQTQTNAFATITIQVSIMMGARCKLKTIRISTPRM